MTTISEMSTTITERFRNVFPGGPYEDIEIDLEWGEDAATVPQALGRDSYPDWFEVAVLDAIPMFRWRGQYKRYANKYPLRGHVVLDATTQDKDTELAWSSWYYVYRPSFISVSGKLHRTWATSRLA